MKDKFSEICSILLKELEEKLRSISISLNKEIDLFFKFLNTSGKNIRSDFFLCLFEDRDIKIDSDILKIAFCIELLHCAALIQDDVFDNSQNRRKIKSLHIQFEDNSNINGKSTSVLFSNIIISYVYEIISELEIENKLKSHIICDISDAIIKTSIGEICDIKSDFTYFDDLDDIFKLYDLKTGFYTFILPFRLFNEFYKIENIRETEKVLYLYARIFQIKNDIYDFTSGIFEDIRQKKLTSVTFFMLNHQNDDKEFIQKDIDEIISILKTIIKDIKNQIKSIDKKTAFSREFPETQKILKKI